MQERGVYPTQDTPRMGTVRVKQEEEADTKILQGRCRGWNISMK